MTPHTPHTQYTDEELTKQANDIINTISRLFAVQSRIDTTQHELVQLTRERDDLASAIDPRILSAISTAAKNQLAQGAQSE